MKNVKKIISLLLTFAFSVILCFSTFAFHHETIYGVKETNAVSPSGGNYSLFTNAGVEGEIIKSGLFGWNATTLRVYCKNDSNEKATIEIYQYKNGRRSKLKAITLNKGQYKYYDISGKNKTDYSIKLSKGNNVMISVTSFLNMMRDDNYKKRKFK